MLFQGDKDLEKRKIMRWKIQSTETEMMTVINIVNRTLRKATVCASKQNCWLSKAWRGRREGREQKKVYSYKLPNGNFSHTLLVWQKCLGCLMAALFTVQQTPGFLLYMSFSSLHCEVWKWQEEKKLVVTHLLFQKPVDQPLLGHLLIVRSYGKTNLFYIYNW